MSKKKKIITIAACFLVIILMLSYIGIITMPKFYLIGYFKNNKQDFEDIVDYLNNISWATYTRFDDNVFSVQDFDIKFKVIKIMTFGGFDGIDSNFGSSDEYTVQFQVSNLFVTKGEPAQIVYSLTELNDDEWSSETYKIKSERICENWYYLYRRY